MRRKALEVLRQDFERLGYYTDNHRLLSALFRTHNYARKTKRAFAALALDGPPGVGKTFAAQTFAKWWNAEHFISFQFTKGVGRDDLMFDMNIVNVIRASARQWHGEFGPLDTVVLGVLPRAIEASKTGRTVLLLDELDKTTQTTDAFLLDFLNDGKLEHSSLGTFRGNPNNLVVFITKNNERELTEPLMRRCRTTVMAWPKKPLEMKIIKHIALDTIDGERFSMDLHKAAEIIVDHANQIRQHANKLKKVPSTPELADALFDIAFIDRDERGATVYDTLLKYESDRREMSMHWNVTPESLQDMLKAA